MLTGLKGGTVKAPCGGTPVDDVGAAPPTTTLHVALGLLISLTPPYPSQPKCITINELDKQGTWNTSLALLSSVDIQGCTTAIDCTYSSNDYSCNATLSTHLRDEL